MESMLQNTGLGISVYLKDYLEDRLSVEQYLDTAAKLGFTEVFTSIHLPEDDFLKIAGAVREFSEMISKKGMNLAIDCSFHEFYRIKENPSLKNDLQRSHIAYLRLDFGFQPHDLQYITHDLNIHGFMLNASIMRRTEIEKMVAELRGFSNELTLKACHNFYPRPETGLGLDFFIGQSTCFKNLGIAVIACVPSRHKPRGPVYMGLPTLESHRNVAIQWAARELIATGVVDEILIGDPFACVEELVDLQEAVASPALVLSISEEPDLSEVEQKILYGTTHVARPDLSDLVIRSNTSREMASRGEKLAARAPIPRTPYSITIDNEKYGRYSGELQIVRQALPADERVNVVGRIVPQDIGLLRYIVAGAEFNLRKYDDPEN
jgi:hypothetical protein